VRWLLRYVRSRTFEAFGAYRIAVALIFWWTVL
jgi:undecaprenyl pyrophosphate phosphatase UppP